MRFVEWVWTIVKLCLVIIGAIVLWSMIWLLITVTTSWVRYPIGIILTVLSLALVGWTLDLIFD